MRLREQNLILRVSKHAERRVARAWGGDRWVNDGSAHSDANEDVPVSLEVTRSKSGLLHAIKKDKVRQCWRNAKTEGREPVLVVLTPNQRVEDAVAVVNHGWLLDVCRRAGVITPEGGTV